VEVFRREKAGAWTHRIHQADDEVELPTLGLTFLVDELYDAAGLVVG
jgi:hypothetical protein